MKPQFGSTSVASNRRGLMLALAGFATLSLGDGLVKSTAGEWPGTAVAALRYLIAAIALGVMTACLRGWAGFAPPRFDIQFGRGAAVALSTLCFFIGAQMMPLADVTSIQFTSPIFVALLSPWLLGERASRAAWMTVFIALAGAAIVLRPALGAIGPAALLPVMAATGMALLVILNRRMAEDADVLMLQFWVAALAAPLLIAGAIIGHLSGIPAFHINMPSPLVILKCAGVAVTGTIAHWLIFAATRYAAAPVIAPTVYVQLLSAALIGWIVFGNGISLLSAFGMALIIMSGLLLWRNETRRTAPVAVGRAT